MTGNPHNPDPLAPPHWLQEQLDEAYDAGIADAHRLHVLAWVLAVGLGIVIGFVIAGSVFATSRSAASAGPQVPTASGGYLSLPSEAPSRLVFHVTTGQGGASPIPAAPEPTDLDDGGGISFALVAGTASFVGPTFGARYLALPEGPGVTVRICVGSRCVVRTSTDAGPDRAMQRKGRVADVSFLDFKYLCRCSPYLVGLIRVTVEGAGGAPTVPPTDVTP